MVTHYILMEHGKPTAMIFTAPPNGASCIVIDSYKRLSEAYAFEKARKLWLQMHPQDKDPRGGRLKGTKHKTGRPKDSATGVVMNDMLWCHCSKELTTLVDACADAQHLGRSAFLRQHLENTLRMPST